MQFKRSVLVAATVALAASVLPAMAKPFKWAGSSDIQTMDIHSQNSALGNGIHGAVYESLVMFNSRTLKVEPVLATSWQQVSPTQMRFKLRQGVRFSDGSAMTADDVGYSLQRAMSKTSTYAIYTQGMDRIAKVDGETIDIFLKNPNPVLLNQLTELRVMSRAWAEKHNSMEPKDIKSKEETYSHRHAMGTGPFVLKEWVPDQKIAFTANPHWWNAGKGDGNVTEITYTPIKSEATRIAALLSGEVDMVRDTSIQDLARIKANPQQGPARAQGAVPGHRHRRAAARDDARPVQPHRRHRLAPGQRLDRSRGQAPALRRQCRQGTVGRGGLQRRL